MKPQRKKVTMTYQQMSDFINITNQLERRQFQLYCAHRFGAQWQLEWELRRATATASSSPSL